MDNGNLWVVAEIINTGRIPEEERGTLLRSDGRGRGPHITVRLIKRMRGKLELESADGRTIIRVLLPVAQKD